MTKPRNPQIGTVPCPWQSCKEAATVHRFQERASSDTRRRFAGKLYADCPVHGRFGAQGSSAFQEYILEEATIWGSDEKPTDAAPAPATKTPEKPAPAPVKPAPKKSSGWVPII